MQIPFSVVNLLLNLLPIYIGFRFIGKKFTLYSCLMIVLSSILTDIIPANVITYDTLLISIFGGIISGCAILGINAVIISLAGLLFGWDKALYSIIFQYASTQVLQMLYKRYQKQTLFIVTNKPKDVCNAIYAVSGHGATILEGEGSYVHCERNVVYSVVSREESKAVIHAVKEADDSVFVNALRTEELSGRFYQRPNE